MAAGMSRRDIVFGLLGAFFLTNAVVAELAGGKLIYVGPESWTLYGARLQATVGVLLWPVVFVTTDLINEYFGTRGVRRLSLLTAGMIGYVYLVLQATMALPATPYGIDDESYNNVFGPGSSIIVGSLLAFLIGQLVDVTVFHALRRRSGKRLLWLRATGSTVVSQAIDTLVVLYVGLAIPFEWTLEQYRNVAVPNYLIKLGLALAMTPVIYAVHWAVERYLGHALADELAQSAAQASE
jgi:uncharacterized integral membrane protein (TIGR00697 family)